MIDINKRSYKKELLDGDNIAVADTLQTMKELNFINTWLGGHSITLKGFKTLLQKKKSIAICELGCGGGDNLNVIYNWCLANKINAEVKGIDINENCRDVIQQTNSSIKFISSDYREVKFTTKPDIIFSSLFCHHFTDEELVQMMLWMRTNAAQGFFINDLHRHKIAYYFIKFTTALFSGSYLIKNDGPLSVLRSFKKKEWKYILQKAGIKNYTIRWQWAFRYLIIVKNDQQ